MKIKQVKSEELIIKILKENNVLVIEKKGNGIEGYDIEAYIVNQENEKIADIVYQVWPRVIGRTQMHKIYKYDNIELRFTLDQCEGYKRNVERLEQKRKAMAKNKAKKEALERAQFIKEAIEYFNGWQEGDNITITADFVNYAEELKEVLKLL